MSRPQGYGVWLDEVGRTVGETALITCCHCRALVRLHDMHGNAREIEVGYCSLCNAQTCPGCAKKAECRPFERQLEAIEARGRMLATLGVVLVIAMASGCRCSSESTETAKPRALLENQCSCPCPCDAASAAPADARVIDLATAWTWHEIHGPSTSTLQGADGADLADVDGDGDLDVVSPWEESARATVSLNPSCAAVRSPWPTTLIPGTYAGAEDARFANVDADGVLDVVVASSGGKVQVAFGASGPTWAAPMTIAAANGPRWLSLAFADFDHDGRADIAACSYSTGGELAILRSPAPRTAASWTKTTLGQVGWCQGLDVRDVNGDGWEDLATSDKDTIHLPVLRYELRGARWLANPAGTGGEWVNHSISALPPANTRFSWFDAQARRAFVGTASGGTANVNTLAWYTSADGLAWTKAAIAAPDNVGWYHAASAADVDGDGDEDLVLTFSEAFGALSGVVWLRNDGGGVYTRGEISGVPGCKFDTVTLVDIDCDGDLDALTTEQGCSDGSTPASEKLGLGWYENPRLPP